MFVCRMNILNTAFLYGSQFIPAVLDIKEMAELVTKEYELTRRSR